MSTHTEVPVAHEVVPATQGLGFAVQETPASAGAADAAVADLVRAAGGAVRLGCSRSSRHACVPRRARGRAARQASGFVAQASPAVQETQRRRARADQVRAAARAGGLRRAVDADQRAGRAGGHARVAERVGVGRAGEPGGARAARAGVAHLVRAAGGPVRLRREGVVDADGRAGRAGGDARRGTGPGSSAQASPAVQRDARARAADLVRAAGRPVRLGGGGVVHAGLRAGGAGGDAGEARVGFVSQASPALQTLHTPALQTEPAPQRVPFGSGARGSSTQTDAPVEHEVMPPRHGSGFVAQASAGGARDAGAAVAHQVRAAGRPVRLVGDGVVHADRRAGRARGDAAEARVRVRRAGERRRCRRCRRRRCRPGSCRRPSRSARARAGLSTQTDVPVAQDVRPVRQGSGLVAQTTPAVHDEHAPALHTRFVPQVVPFAFGGAVHAGRRARGAGGGAVVAERVRVGRAGEAGGAGGAGAAAAHEVRAAGRAVRLGRGGVVHADRGARGAGGDAAEARIRVGRAGEPGGAGGAGAAAADLVRAAGGPVRLGGGGVVHADRRAGGAGGLPRRGTDPGWSRRRAPAVHDGARAARCTPGSSRRSCRSPSADAVDADRGAGRAGGDADVAERVGVGRAGEAGGAGGAGARAAHEVRPAARAVRAGRRRRRRRTCRSSTT